MQKFILCGIFSTLSFFARTQLTIDRNTIFYIQNKGEVFLEGDLTSRSEIQGDGFIVLSGKQPSRIIVNGPGINNLSINAAAPVILESDLRINANLLLQSGFLQVNKYQLILTEQAQISGSDKSYVQTDGTGTVKKIIDGTLSDYVIPIGTCRAYMPLTINAKGNNRRGILNVAAKAKASDHKPEQIRDYLKYTWSVGREGNLQKISVSGQYGLNDLQGSAGRLSSYYWNGISWVAQSKTNQPGKVSANITSNAGELYAMNDVIAGVPAGIKLINNPARSFTALEINATEERVYHVEVADVTGRKFQQKDIKTPKGVNRHIIYLSGLAAGTYFLKVSSPAEKQTFKILKVD